MTLHANASDGVALALEAFSTAASAATLFSTAVGVERRGPLPPGSWERFAGSDFHGPDPRRRSRSGCGRSRSRRGRRRPRISKP